MFGWGYPQNLPRQVASPLFARALAVEHLPSKQRLIYVCCDLLMISESVRAEVRSRLSDLDLSDSALLLTATHTHSGPSGFSAYLFYAMAAPGYSRRVHDTIVDGIVASVRGAVAALRPAQLRVGSGQVPIRDALAFNRAVRSHNRNPEVTPVDRGQRAAAVDRTMTVLRIDDLSGQPLGLVSWFGVHCTSVHRDHQVIHPDHKGEAATCLEERERAAGNPGYVALFAQTAPGDVSPNARWHPRRGFDVGPLEDDFASAALLGRMQAEHASTIAAALLREPPIGSDAESGQAVAGAAARGPRAPFAMALRYVDFFAAPVAPEFVDGKTGLSSAPPILGWGYTAGTREGPGPFQKVHRVTSTLARALRPLSLAALRRAAPADPVPVDGEKALTEDAILALHGRKIPFIQLYRGRENRLLGLIAAKSPLIGLVKNPFVDYLRRAVQDSAAATEPWVPRYLPLQIVQLGPLVLAALPMEPTVQSGRRIAQAVARELGESAQHVVVNGYSNAYAAYVTTPEEYAAQRYEGSATLFGQWSLPALCTAFASLARDLHAHNHTGAYGPPPALDIGHRPRPLRLEDALPPVAVG
jgi:neutral ceramidase